MQFNCLLFAVFDKERQRGGADIVRGERDRERGGGGV